MEGIRFYEDYQTARDKNKKNPESRNGLLVMTSLQRADGSFDAIASVFERGGDGPYTSTAVDYGYLSKCCRRISEDEARELFPELMTWVEGVPNEVS